MNEQSMRNTSYIPDQSQDFLKRNRSQEPCDTSTRKTSEDFKLPQLQKDVKIGDFNTVNKRSPKKSPLFQNRNIKAI